MSQPIHELGRAPAAALIAEACRAAAPPGWYSAEKTAVS